MSSVKYRMMLICSSVSLKRKDARVVYIDEKVIVNILRHSGIPLSLISNFCLEGTNLQLVPSILRLEHTSEV